MQKQSLSAELKDISREVIDLIVNRVSQKDKVSLASSIAIVCGMVFAANMRNIEADERLQKIMIDHHIDVIKGCLEQMEVCTCHGRTH